MVDDLRELDHTSLASPSPPAPPPPHPFSATITANQVAHATGVSHSHSPSSSSVPMRCPSLDSCHSRDQFLISMVNEFLNDTNDAAAAMDETSIAKSSSLNIVEYMEQPHATEVESLMDFHHIKELQEATCNEDNTATTSAIVLPSSPSSSLFANLTTAGTSGTTTTSNNASAPALVITPESTEMPTILLTIQNENLPTNVREISYQRFGRINRNLPPEVHNFKCHLCAFSCKRKELLLQHFQEKHPT